MKLPKIKTKLNVWGYLALGYFFVVMLGSVLLVLPFASKEGSTPYIDALFTSVSATCVTGLVPFDTNVHWTLFGQIVILLLIQTGGLGFMTFVSVLLLMVKHGLNQYARKAVLQSVGGGDLSGVRALVRRILIGTAVFELVGAGLLSIRFIPLFGAARGMWYALFHAVSAFCNAGFDLMGGTAYGTGSLSYFATDPLVVITVCALIFIGGLGFCIWGDIWECRGNPKKFQFYTHVILIADAALILIGTALFLGFEWRNSAYTGYNFGERLLTALFNSTTPRTAGFYTTDPSTFSDSGYLLTVMLMFIGGCSGSTAGGIKVGTFAVVVMGMVSVLRSKRDLTIGKRRIDTQLLGQALAIVMAYLFLILMSTLLICAVEPDGTDTFARTLFETVSAVATVGLTMNFTPTLGAISKLVIIVLMYAGRVGVLTLAFAVARKRDTAQIRRPVDTFFIG